MWCLFYKILIILSIILNIGLIYYLIAKLILLPLERLKILNIFSILHLYLLLNLKLNNLLRLIWLSFNFNLIFLFQFFNYILLWTCIIIRLYFFLLIGWNFTNCWVDGSPLMIFYIFFFFHSNDFFHYLNVFLWNKFILWFLSILLLIMTLYVGILIAAT